MTGHEAKNWKEDSLNKHERSKRHVHAQVMENKARQELGTNVSRLAQRYMRAEAYAGMRLLFNMAAYIAKKERPVRDFKDLCQLQKRSGVKVEERYINEKQCKVFIGYIAKYLREVRAEKMKRSAFVSLLVNTSGLAEQAQCQVFIKFATKGAVPEIMFLGLENLDQMTEQSSGRIELMKLAARYGFELEKVVGVGTDEIGPKLAEDATNQLTVPCVTHNLQTAIVEACKSVEYFRTTFDPAITNICKFLLQSSNSTVQFEAVGKLDELISTLGVRRVQWLSSNSAMLAAIVLDRCTIYEHVEKLQADDLDMDMLESLKVCLSDHLFVKVLHFMADALCEIKKLTEIFQKQDLYITELRAMLATCYENLENLKSNVQKGGLLEKFEEGFSSNLSTLKNIDKGESEFETVKLALIKEFQENLKNRFSETVGNVIVQTAGVFDPSTWPEPLSQDFGNNEIQIIVIRFASHLRHALSQSQLCDDECDIIDSAVVEWKSFKRMTVKSGVTQRFSDTRAVLQSIMSHSERYTVLPLVAQIIVLLPCSSTHCHQGSLAYERIRTHFGCSPAEVSVEDRMLCLLHLPADLDSFPAAEAVEMWYADTPGLLLDTRDEDEKRMERDDAAN